MSDIGLNSTLPPHTNLYNSPSCEEKDIWFDASDEVEIEDLWFDAGEETPDASLSPEEKAEACIPFSEDCRRCVKRLIIYFAEIKEQEYFFSFLERFIPDFPADVILTARSLYNALCEKKNVDIALLNSLGVIASRLLSNGNAIARLAEYLQQTLQDYIGQSFSTHDVSHHSSSLTSTFFGALGIVAIVARYWMKDEGAPQRRLLRLPAFLGNLFIRANYYWNQLGRIAHYASESCVMLQEESTNLYLCFRDRLNLPAASPNIIDRAAWRCSETAQTALPVLKSQSSCPFQLTSAELQLIREQGVCYFSHPYASEAFNDNDSSSDATVTENDINVYSYQEHELNPTNVLAQFNQALSGLLNSDRAIFLPVVSAAPSRKREYIGRAGDEQIIIYDKDGMILDLTPDYYDVVNKPQAYNFLQTGREAIKNYYDFYYSYLPDLKNLAATLLKEKIQEKFQLHIDPDKTSFKRFDSASSSSKTFTGWEHTGEPVEEGTLTQYLFSNFPASAQENLISLDALCGIYTISAEPEKAFNEKNEVKILPSDFVKLVWEIDFYQHAKTIISDSFSDPDVHIKKYFTDFILGLSMSALDSDAAQDVLNGAGILSDREINVSFFDINGYEADNAFIFHNKKSGRVTLYLPGYEPQFIAFSNLYEMRLWVVSSCANPQKQERIASHFRLYARQDGVFRSGVDSWLQKLRTEPQLYEKIAIQHAAIRQKSFFQTYFNQMKAKSLADLDVLIKSDAEVRRDMWENYVDAANIIPNPFTFILALGLHLERALEADTPKERLAEWYKIAADAANIALMILMDKMIKFNTKGYQFIDQVKEGISTLKVRKPLSSGKRLKNILEQGLGGRGSKEAARAWRDEMLAGPSGEQHETAAQQNDAPYLAAWRTWRNGGLRGEMARRNTVVKMLQERLEKKTSDVLDLSAANIGPLSDLPGRLPPCRVLILNGQAHLRALPALLPEGVKEIHARGCNISLIPENLPDNIRVMDLHDNKIRKIPRKLPARLRKLNVNKNFIETLPDNIFRRLKEFYAANNQLIALPKNMYELNILTVDGNRITRITALPPTLKRLSAGYNQLYSLPPLPDSLESLLVSNNLLPDLPPLPAGLRTLSVNNNRLTQLPILPTSLETLCANENQLTQLSAFPPSVAYVSLRDNQLTALPELPATINMLFMQDNQLTTLPESLFHLDRTAWVDVSGNPLSQQTLTVLQELNQQPEAPGPGTIRFTMPRTASPTIALPLDEVVSLWLSPEALESSGARWQSIAREENASHFSVYLGRLISVVSAKTSPTFRNKVSAWLARLADSPELREKTFALAQEATATCEDRVAWNFNEMQKFVIIESVERGEYDQNLPGLVNLGRQMFRLERLELIARAKVKTLRTLRAVDELEVYFAFQVQLRAILKLETWVDAMRFFKSSSVTNADLSHAARQVMREENQRFTSWCAQWTPWKEAIKRLDSALYHSVTEAFREEVEHHFDHKVKDALAAEGLPENGDTTRTMGKIIYDDMAKKSDQQMTEQFLQARGLSELLNNVWEEDTP